MKSLLFSSPYYTFPRSLMTLLSGSQSFSPPCLVSILSDLSNHWTESSYTQASRFLGLLISNYLLFNSVSTSQSHSLAQTSPSVVLGWLHQDCLGSLIKYRFQGWLPSPPESQFLRNGPGILTILPGDSYVKWPWEPLCKTWFLDGRAIWLWHLWPHWLSGLIRLTGWLGRCPLPQSPLHVRPSQSCVLDWRGQPSLM